MATSLLKNRHRSATSEGIGIAHELLLGHLPVRNTVTKGMVLQYETIHPSKHRMALFTSLAGATKKNIIIPNSRASPLTDPHGRDTRPKNKNEMTAFLRSIATADWSYYRLDLMIVSVLRVGRGIKNEFILLRHPGDVRLLAPSKLHEAYLGRLRDEVSLPVLQGRVCVKKL